jgi:hypothetical protein
VALIARVEPSSLDFQAEEEKAAEKKERAGQRRQANELADMLYCKSFTSKLKPLLIPM